MAARVSTIFWGTGYENTLSLGYPLYNIVTDHEPRAGSEWVQGVDGAEDAWITGYDWTLECEARWLPVTPNVYGSQAPNPLQSQVSGPTGVQAFLDWARAKNPFRFCPDYTLPLFYIDGCYLVEPRGGRGITASLDFSQQLKFRNATTDFLQALRGILFEYAPGADISSYGMNGTFERDSVATRIGADGLLYTDAANVLRDRHYVGGVRTTLLEPARTNIVLHNRDLTITHQLTVTGGSGTFVTGETVTATGGGTGIYVAANSTATLFAIRTGSGTFTGTLTGGTSGATKTISSAATVWVRSSVTPVRDQVGMDGGTNSASSLLATGANATLLQAITLASSARFQAIYVKRITGSGTIQMTTDNGSTWTTIATTAAYVRVSIPTQTLANPTVGFKIVTSGDKIAVDYVQNEAGVFATSAIATTTAAAVRAGDHLVFPYSYRPQTASLYAKLIEAGAVLTASGSNYPTVVNIGSYGAPPNWRNLICFNGAGYYTLYNGNNAGQVSQGMAANPTLGQSFELLGTVAVNGAIKLYQSIAGAADTASATSAALAMPSEFGVAQLAIGDLSYPETVLQVVAIKFMAGVLTANAQARAA